MIQDRVVAGRYGEAFVKYAHESMGIEKILSDLKEVRATFHDNPDLKKFLENPGIALVDKNALIDKVVDGGIAAEVRHFLKLLIDHGRIEHITDIIEYIRLKYAHAGEEAVLLKTSYPMDLDLVKKIKDKLKEKWHKKIKLFIELDSSLMGGVKVIMGNKVIDGSVRRRLEELKERLQAIEVK
jgi:F-type H+-transporting ATPase subunit delta